MHRWVDTHRSPENSMTIDQITNVLVTVTLIEMMIRSDWA